MEKQFWDKYAPVYNKFMRKDRAAYAEICALIREKAEGKKVLEVCTGTGLIAKEVADVTEYMFLFKSSDFTGDLIEDCDEGELRWIPWEEVDDLPLWEGDRRFLPLLRESTEFFTMKLIYDADGNLVD